MRSLLVTGASGFVGRHFIIEAARRGFAITAIARAAKPDWLPNDVCWIATDISEPHSLDKIARDYWGVAHFANISIPADYFDESVILKSVAMTERLVAHLRSARFLFPSSCHVYSASDEVKQETSETNPAGRYGKAKLLSEEVVLECDHIDARVARPFNHIGKFMQSGLMLPALAERITRAKAGEPIIMYGRNSVRDFLDVRDIVNSYLILLELDAPQHRIFNICSGNPISVKQLAEHFVRVAGKDNPIFFEQKQQSADDIDRLVGDPSRILTMTHWRPKVRLDDSIRYSLSS